MASHKKRLAWLSSGSTAVFRTCEIFESFVRIHAKFSSVIIEWLKSQISTIFNRLDCYCQGARSLVMSAGNLNSEERDHCYSSRSNALLPLQRTVCWDQWGPSSYPSWLAEWDSLADLSTCNCHRQVWMKGVGESSNKGCTKKQNALLEAHTQKIVSSASLEPMNILVLKQRWSL